MNPTEKRQVTTLAKKTNDVLGMATTVEVTDDEQLKTASAMLADVKTISKDLTTAKKAILDPLTKAAKEVRALFKLPEDNVATAEKAVKAAILAYHEAQDAIAQAEIAKIENRTKAGKGNYSVATAMQKLANVDQAETNMGGAQIKLGPQRVRITDVIELIGGRLDLLNTPRVMEAVRLELQAEINNGGDVPKGAELYREKLVAGYAA